MKHRLSAILAVGFTLALMLSAGQAAEVDYSAYMLQIFKEIKGQDNFKLQAQDVASKGQAIVPTLSQIMFDKEADWKHRWFAVMTLAEIGGEPARVQLKKGLQNELFIVRLASVKGLALLGDPAMTVDLHRLIGDSAMVVRSEVAYTLAKFKDQQAVLPLSEQLHQAQNFYRGRSLPVRGQIVKALGSLGNASAVPSLMQELKREDDQLHGLTLAALTSTASQGKYNNSPPAGLERQTWLSWWATETGTPSVTPSISPKAQVEPAKPETVKESPEKSAPAAPSMTKPVE